MNFIEEYWISPEICNELINFYWRHEEWHQDGSVNNSKYGQIVDLDVKNSSDFLIAPCCKEPIFEEYISVLTDIVNNQYFAKYEKANLEWKIQETVNIQRYPPNDGGFKEWHSERVGRANMSRHLVFMTYLNTLDDGHTEFYYQNLKIKPEIGKTVIWLPDWTHTHRGVPSSQEKYIITGWINYA